MKVGVSPCVSLTVCVFLCDYRNVCLHLSLSTSVWSSMWCVCVSGWLSHCVCSLYEIMFQVCGKSQLLQRKTSLQLNPLSHTADSQPPPDIWNRIKLNDFIAKKSLQEIGKVWNINVQVEVMAIAKSAFHIYSKCKQRMECLDFAVLVIHILFL